MVAAFPGTFDRLARLNSGDLPYPILVLFGLPPWTFFADAVNSAVENKRLVTKERFLH